jgi:hypothetical protein
MAGSGASESDRGVRRHVAAPCGRRPAGWLLSLGPWGRALTAAALTTRVAATVLLRYGEKLVKGSTNPRSYYKCSHLGCVAKKIVERCDRSGDILSTEYKVGGATRPCPAGRLGMGCCVFGVATQCDCNRTVRPAPGTG